MRVVVDDQDAAPAEVRLKETGPRDLGPLAETRGEAEDAALAGLALHRHLAAHEFGELLGDGEPKPGPAIFPRGRGVGLLEGLE